MAATGFSQTPLRHSYDVVIIGGAMMGSAAAFYLTRRPDFDGHVLVVDQDPSFAKTATAHTNSCIRQQFSTELNVRVSQYTADVIHGFRDLIGDARAPELAIQNFGYLYLAQDAHTEAQLRADVAVQHAAGAGTELLSPQEIAARYPFYDLSDIRLGSLNTKDEGYWEGGTVFDWFRRAAQKSGAEYVADRVSGIATAGGRATHVTLAGMTAPIACGAVINAAGTRGPEVAAMAGLSLPVEPRKRTTWVVRLPTPLPCQLPLTVDPSGVHMRQDGPDTYMIGAAAQNDHAVEVNDFAPVPDLWEERVWPALAARIPAFETLRIVSEWVGHYDFNTIDQNAVLGPAPTLANFHFCNGFSGHGLQQAPAMGRGLAELICAGRYETLDMSPFGIERLSAPIAHKERAII